MTNQASEKELDTFMEQLGFFWDSFQSDWRNNGRKQFSRDYDDSISMELAKQLLAHLLTEKLKLLDEVRERVIGENDRGTITDPDSPSYGEPYESTTADKEELRAELTKLEAEL